MEKVRLKFKTHTQHEIINRCIKIIDKYALYFTNDPHDLPQIYNLRFKVFFEEFSEASFIRKFYPIDRDQHDEKCTHIVVKNLENGKIIGTYRAFIGKKWDQHYSEEQFQLDTFLLTNTVKCEVGRACIHREHRNGVVLRMLLQGVIHFCDINNCEYLFGQSSWSRKNCDDLDLLYDYLISSDAILNHFSIAPKPNYLIDNFDRLSSPDENIFIPPLIKMYVLAGAKFIKLPAYDKKMDCYDFFTLLNLKSNNRFLNSIRRKNEMPND